MQNSTLVCTLILFFIIAGIVAWKKGNVALKILGYIRTGVLGMILLYNHEFTFSNAGYLTRWVVCFLLSEVILCSIDFLKYVISHAKYIEKDQFIIIEYKRELVLDIVYSLGYVAAKTKIELCEEQIEFLEEIGVNGQIRSLVKNCATDLFINENGKRLKTPKIQKRDTLEGILSLNFNATLKEKMKMQEALYDLTYAGGESLLVQLYKNVVVDLLG